jgi:hypothetical protein
MGDTFCFGISVAMRRPKGNQTMIKMALVWLVLFADGGGNDRAPDTSSPRLESRLPRNVVALVGLDSILKEMMFRSATFRKQCKVIDQTVRVRVVVTLSLEKCRPYRALSTVQHHKGGAITIKVVIRALDDYVELIAHEFEHVIEQIEGLDLVTLSQLKGSGVRRTEEGAFETLRAHRVGLRVAAEYYARK